jgi:hypothetical protein
LVSAALGAKYELVIHSDSRAAPMIAPSTAADSS